MAIDSACGLRRLIGLKSNFTILDTDDQIRLLKQLISAANIDEKRWPARQLAGLIDNWKNRAWGPEKVPSAEGAAFNYRGTELYAAYQERLRTLNATDFGDLLLHCVTIFQKHPDVLEQYQRWFRYILVDEYQDTNVAQYLWLRLLAAAHSIVPELAEARVVQDADRLDAIGAIGVARCLMLSGQMGRQVSLQVVVDPNVIGGVRVTVGDHYFEGTVAGRLENARRQLS